MLVRILNSQQDTDRFFDCRNSCIRKSNREDKEDGEFLLDFEFEDGAPITVVLATGDAIYYMNDAGNTVHSDCRMCK